MFIKAHQHVFKTNVIINLIRHLTKARIESNDDLPTYVYANQDATKPGSKSKLLYTWGFSSTGALGSEKHIKLERKKLQNRIVKPTPVKFYNDMKVSKD